MRLAVKKSREEKRRKEREGPGQTSGVKKAKAVLAMPAPAADPPGNLTGTTLTGTSNPVLPGPDPVIKIKSDTSVPSVPPGFTRKTTPKKKGTTDKGMEDTATSPKRAHYSKGMGSKIVQAAQEGMHCTIGDIPNIIMDLVDERVVDTSKEMELVFQDDLDAQAAPRDRASMRHEDSNSMSFKLKIMEAQNIALQHQIKMLQENLKQQGINQENALVISSREETTNSSDSISSLGDSDLEGFNLEGDSNIEKEEEENTNAEQDKA